MRINGAFGFGNGIALSFVAMEQGVSAREVGLAPQL